MSQKQSPPEEPEIPEPAVHDPAMEINVGEDLLAAALAAVEKRMEKKKPSAEEMAEIEADIEVDVAGLEDDGSVVLGEDENDSAHEEEASSPAAVDSAELDDLKNQLAKARLDARKLKAIGKKELKE